jgi:hypothetical protein
MAPPFSSWTQTTTFSYGFYPFILICTPSSQAADSQPHGSNEILIDGEMKEKRARQIFLSKQPTNHS